MTDETTTPAPAPAEEPAAEAVETEDDPVGPAIDWQEARRIAPRVVLQVPMPTDPESWADAEGGEDMAAITGETDPLWNAPFTSRPDIRVQARQIPVAFTFSVPDAFTTMRCAAGDWLIKDLESGYVYAITDRAFRHIYQATTDEPIAEPAAEEPQA